MINTERKMFFIAQHFSWLNAKGRVKAIKGNEQGYAKIKDVVRGCGLFVHHLNDGQLVINLFVSPAAKLRYEIHCNKAVDIFNDFFRSEAKQTIWQNSMGDNKIYDRYIVDVTKNELPEIIRIIEEIKTKLTIA